MTIDFDHFECLEKLPIGIFILRLEDEKNLEFRNVYVNQTNCDIVGVDLTPFMGKTLRESFPDAYEHGLPQKYLEALRTQKKIQMGEVQYGDQTVEEQIFVLEVVPLNKDTVMLTTENMSKLNRANSILEQKNELLTDKNKELEQLSFLVSHDLKTPLNTITMATEILQEDYEKAFDDLGKQLMHTIVSASKRMHSLIKEILDYSLLGTKKTKQSVYCRNLINDCLENLESAITDSKASVEIGKYPEQIFGYKAELHQLFQNVLSNAIKYKHPNRKPEIKLSATLKDDFWEYCISDNGMGINEEDQKEIFNVFHRLREDSQTEGQGIGLAHCKKIVELHNGKIWVKSTEGQGSEFYFTLEAKLSN